MIVFDPKSLECGFQANGWPADYVTNNLGDFLKAVWDSERCLIVIDEAPTAFDQDRNGCRQVLERASGKGHIVIVIAQRHKRVDKTARDQCPEVFVFSMSKDDCDELAIDFNCPELAECYTLPRYNYVHFRRFGTPCKGVTKPI